ncbi:TylF/MycF family methyltransferase [Nocardia sp. NPDC020380]|uniref:TylF/MycF family methyltransferase n=1 Tax=Nocardia sp. NPDC020380 TaxID=3364309 RepID=UPI0037906321
MGSELYLDLMKKTLVNSVYEDPPVQLSDDVQVPWRSPSDGYDPTERALGEDWPSVAHTMAGTERLNNVHHCLQTITADAIPGDLIETGVWRGGICIFMRAYLRAHDIKDRTVWVADSFQGMPEIGPDGHPMDHRLALHRANHVLGIPLEQVRQNFAKYDLLDDQVRFLPGWFHDTLPTAPIDQLAILRLDGDLYQSTLDSLTHLYPKLSPGGYVIIDDYVLPPVHEAVLEYRRQHGISDRLRPVDISSACWRREE